MTEERLKDSLTKLARAELDRVFDQPLSEKELESMRKKIIRNCHAGQRMYEEYSVELSQLRMHFHHDNLKLQDQPLNKLLTEHVHEERIRILARSAVRRRWQRLGVWKDDWVPKTCDRNNPGVTYHPSDSVLPEEWGWTKNVTPPDDERHPVRRVIRRRTGLRRGQLGPPPPRCRNRSSNSSADEMESFITSRPWFLFKICVFEEEARRERLPLLLPWKLRLDEPRQIVRRQWERMGIWLPKWNKSAEPGWHWYFEERSSPRARRLHSVRSKRTGEAPVTVGAALVSRPGEDHSGVRSRRGSSRSCPSQTNEAEGIILTPAGPRDRATNPKPSPNPTCGSVCGASIEGQDGRPASPQIDSTYYEWTGGEQQQQQQQQQRRQA
ncbi:hypothetical protein IF1G_07880 [Cordyceps javanica]|uniref:Uncharacterized protein n=1 Tax=Cordyceps javanica TaxID=43265 RepID=A0A545UV21_9HYPO|nr:hypothetical protein IF1G_07880 [Cordyceps javanica]TQW05342.1 hypothetical protein IF2G_07279 [Cordyceps javanica]